MTTNDDSIKWVVERLQALNQEHEEARRADRVVDHAACRIASETCLQELLQAYDRLDEAQAEVERLKAEVERLKAEIQPRIERSIAFQDAMEEAEAERAEARAEVMRLQAERDADYHEGYRAGQEDMQDRCAALCDDWEADSYCDGWQMMELGARYCAEAIRALEVES